MYLCPVRGCRLPLTQADRSWVCPSRHRFDVARSGYVNLLQPQDRRSRHPGDTVEMVRARQSLHATGATQPMLDAIETIAVPTAADIVLDVGCGDGYYLGTLAERTGCLAYGTDISASAIDAAARRYPDCAWSVANADRFLPYADAAFSLVLSITARHNPQEFRRVLKDDGRLLVAVPAPEDLKQIRGGEAAEPGRDRTARILEDFGSTFECTTQRRVTTEATLTPDQVKQVRTLVYRPRGNLPAEPIPVTFSLDWMLFRPRAGHPAKSDKS